MLNKEEYTDYCLGKLRNDCDLPTYEIQDVETYIEENNVTIVNLTYAKSGWYVKFSNCQIMYLRRYA